MKYVVKTQRYKNECSLRIYSNPLWHIAKGTMTQCTEVRFARFLSGGFITAIVVNPPESKLAKRTSVQWLDFYP